MDIELLANRPEFFDDAAALLYTEFSEPSGRTMEDRIAMLRENTSGRRDYVTYVAHANGMFLGTATFAASDLETRPELTPWLASVAVPPRARRQGVARKMVEVIEDHARADGVGRLYLFTPDRMRLYYLGGWRPMETFAYADGRIHTLMAKDL